VAMARRSTWLHPSGGWDAFSVTGRGQRGQILQCKLLDWVACARKLRRAGQLTPGRPIARRVRGGAVRSGAGEKVRKKGRGEADKPVPHVSERKEKGRGHRRVGLRCKAACWAGWVSWAGGLA
jgi:hypothetical protein